MDAIQAGHVPSVQFLLQAGANSGLKNNASQTAQDLAQELEDKTIQKKILQLLKL